MIIEICLIVFLYSLLFFVIKKDTKKKEEIEKVTIEIKKDEVKKLVTKPKKISKEELLLSKTIEMFERVFQDEFKYVRNFIVTDSITNQKTKIDLLLLTAKGLFVVNAKVVMDGIVYLRTLDETNEDWKISRHDKNHKQIITNLKNPLKKLEKQITALENLDLKYHFYYEPLVVFSRNTAVRKPYLTDDMQDIIVENIVIAEQKLKKLKEEEDDLFTEQKIEYLHKYLMSKKFKEED